MKAYLFGSIFYEKDIEYNKLLLQGIRRAWPGIDIYAPQEAPFNDKRSFGDSHMIFQGDYNRLKEVDLLIGCLDGDCPPIGSTCEAGLFCALAKENPKKQMVVLHTDTRDGYKTWSEEKFEDMANNQCHSQMNYFNLFLTGVIEECGVIVGTQEQLFEYVSELYFDYMRNNHFPGIYMITNRINNKKYIGLSKDVPQRLNKHRFISNDNPQAIDLAIQKYGIENFTFEVLEQCNEEILREREKYWCDEVYGATTYAPNGYNIAVAGGQFGNHGIVISQYTLDGKKIKTYPSILAAAREMKCNPHAISQALDNQYASSLGYMWCSGTDDICDAAEINKHHGDYKETDVYDEHGVFLASFETITEAANAYNVQVTAASQSYNNEGTRAKRYYFCKKGEKPVIDLRKRKKTIYCYDKRTREYVNEYNTAKAAGDATNSDPSGIAKAAKGQAYYAGNYIWSYQKFDKIMADYKTFNENFWKENSSSLENE